MKRLSKVLLFFTIPTISAYSAVCHAHLINYVYTGSTFNTLSNGNQNIEIEFIIDDSLISANGHFEKSINLVTTVDYNQPTPDLSPFESFKISYKNLTIDDQGLYFTPDNYYISRSNKMITALFDTDDQGNISSWNIKGYQSYFSPSGDDWQSIESSSLIGDYYISGYRTPSDPADYETKEGTSFQGSWRRSVIPVNTVPLPGSLLLFLPGIVYLFERNLRALLTKK